MGDADLVAYIAEAAKDGDVRAARRAIAILAWGWQPYIELRVGGKVPHEHVETVTAAALESAIAQALGGKATFDSATVREFRGWLTRIIDRRIADHYRSTEHRRGTRLALAEELGHDEAGIQLTSRDATEAVADQLLVEEELAKLGHDHRVAAEMMELQGYSAADVVAHLGRRNANWAYKNAERFRARVAAAVGHQPR